MKYLMLMLLIINSVAIAYADCKIAKITGLPTSIIKNDVRAAFIKKNYKFSQDGMEANFQFTDGSCGFDGGSCIDLLFKKNGKVLRDIHVINYGASSADYLLNDVFARLERCTEKL